MNPKWGFQQCIRSVSRVKVKTYNVTPLLPPLPPSPLPPPSLLPPHAF